MSHEGIEAAEDTWHSPQKKEIDSMADFSAKAMKSLTYE